MTSKLTIEQAKRLRNDFECWQQDYDPKDDKEQYDMFGRGMAAMDMLIAGMYQEPVAYMVRRHDEHEGTGTLIHAEYLQRYQDRGDYHYTPLYRHAQPAPQLKPVGYLFVSDQGDVAYSPTGWGVPGFKLAGQIFGDIDVKAQPAPVVPDEVEHVAAVLELIGSFEAADIDSDTVDLRFEIDDVDTGSDASITEYAARGAAIIRMLAGNSPVIPDGYVMVPKEPTDEMIAAAMNCDDVEFNSDETFCVQFGNIYEAMLAAAPQPQNEPQNIPEIISAWIPVSERMPETNKFVLVSNGVWVGQGLYDDSEHLESDEHWQDEHREFINVLHHPVTHWMPLPAAPQEVQCE